MPRPILSTFVSVASFVVATSGFAQGDKPARDPAAAEALYKAARELVQKDDWAAACPKFAASMELDPAASTLINVAKCLEREGKPATAWAELRRARALNQDTPGEERRRTLDELITKALEELEPKLPKLRLTITPRPPGVEVTRDGLNVPLAMLDESIPLDPGRHVVTVRAPGYVPVERAIEVEPGRTAALDVTLARASASPPARQPPPPEPAATIPVWPFVTGGVALALVGVGAGFRIHGAGIESTLDERCGPERVCDPRGGYDPSDDNQQKNVDFGLFVGLTVGGGAVALATAIGLAVEIATAPEEPKEARVRSWAPPGTSGVGVEISL